MAAKGPTSSDVLKHDAGEGEEALSMVNEMRGDYMTDALPLSAPHAPSCERQRADALPRRARGSATQWRRARQLLHRAHGLPPPPPPPPHLRFKGRPAARLPPRRRSGCCAPILPVSSRTHTNDSGRSRGGCTPCPCVSSCVPRQCGRRRRRSQG